MTDSILVVDDEPHFLDTIKRGLSLAGFRDVATESNPVAALARLEDGEKADLVLLDVSMPEMDGLTLLSRIRNLCPDTECIMVTAINDTRIAVDCIRRGAYDYLLKPVSREDLVFAVNRALERKRLLAVYSMGKAGDDVRDDLPEAFDPIVTRSPALIRVLREACLHAGSNVQSLITGESGTGKELLARAMHQASLRSDMPFTAINMASLAPTLFDAEFFGHTRGAFTGAQSERKGYLETTHRGTLFLDEIGHLPLELQGKLLRVFQEGEYMKLGTSRVMKADIRFIAATNADLTALVESGQFRKDLYYRLKGAWLNLPSLRERREDIPLLVSDFMAKKSGGEGRAGITQEAMNLLMAYDFPGNVRELQSIVASAMNLARKGDITAQCIPAYVHESARVAPTPCRPVAGKAESLFAVEKNHIVSVFESTGRNKMQTARILDIGLNTLRRKLKTYGLD
ncbi:MAG: sigma-54-dependent Fis family transcriptional regulator [Deltaproteobacteria bacterium]|nr:sigma-54-dependent Fis family transcriptional regulator [Deltaproteobacteria bacterium]